MTKVTLHFLSVFAHYLFFATMVSNLRAKVCKYLEEDGLCGILFLSCRSAINYKIEQQRQSREVAENERTLEELKSCRLRNASKI